LATASAQLKQTSDDRDAAQSKLSPQLESVNGELTKTKQAAEQADAKADDAANTAKALQGALDQANAQIERLKAELDQRPLPPVSVSPPGVDSSSPQ
jgi:chromosome segregation ATPase